MIHSIYSRIKQSSFPGKELFTNTKIIEIFYTKPSIKRTLRNVVNNVIPKLSKEIEDA